MKLAYWVYKRFLLLFAAYGGVFSSTTMFPNPPDWSISSFIGEVLFSPLKLLLAVLLFMLGFLAYSLFVRDFVRIWSPRFTDLSLRLPRILFVFLAFLTWIHLFSKSGMVALLALVLALWYGIMDVKSEINNR